MLRHVLLALTLVAVVGLPLRADSIGVGSHRSLYGPLYSGSSSPFEAFEWTSLDFAAFSAYGGDFSNLRRPVVPVFFFDDPMQPAVEPGPEDEQVNIRLLSALPFFEELPAAMLKDVHDEQLVSDVPDAVPSIPEPGALMLVGLGLLGLSRRVRAYYAR
jgi:PEP-CTERM motif